MVLLHCVGVHKARYVRDRVTRKGKEHTGKVFTGEVTLGPGLMKDIPRDIRLAG